MDQRIGNWLFLYAVLQSLPMLVVDAPGLSFTEGVEYFLCQPSTGNPPWFDGRNVEKHWFQVGGGVVQLSTDTIMFSTEATYARSHCWLAAKEWQAMRQEAGAPALPPQEVMSPLHAPPGVFSDGDVVASPTSTSSPGLLSPGSGSSSQVTLRPQSIYTSHRNNRAIRSSIALGLELLPHESLPLEPPPPPRAAGSSSRSSSAGRPPSSHMGSRNASVGNLAGMATQLKQDAPQPAATSGATFDDILADTQKKPVTKKKSKFF
jgi:hypothetical protein